MTAGTVTVANDGAVTKTGMAEALYDAIFAAEVAKANTNGVTFPTGADSAAPKRAIASLVNALSSALVSYITTNAQAVIPTSAGGAGLQRTPDPNDPSTATLAPATQKTLAIV